MATNTDELRRRLPDRASGMGSYAPSQLGQPDPAQRNPTPITDTVTGALKHAFLYNSDAEAIRQRNAAPAAPARPPVASLPGGVTEQLPTVPDVPQIGETPAFRRSAFGPAIQNQGQTSGDRVTDMGYATRSVQGASGVTRMDGRGRTIYTDDLANTADWIEGGMRSGVNTLPAQGGAQDAPSSLAQEFSARADRMRALREENTALRDNLNFNAGGALSRQKTQDEITRDMLTGQSRSGRQAAVQLMGDQQRAGIERQRMAIDQQRADADRMTAEASVNVSRAELDQQRRIRGLQDRLIDEQDPGKRAQFERTLGILSGRDASSGRDRFITVQGGQVSTPDGMGVMTAPSRVFDTQTQRYVDVPPAAQGDARQQEGAMLRGKDGRMYQVKGGVPVPIQ